MDQLVNPCGGLEVKAPSRLSHGIPEPFRATQVDALGFVAEQLHEIIEIAGDNQNPLPFHDGFIVKKEHYHYAQVS